MYSVMKRITNIVKNKYYTYKPGEFLPIYEGHELINKRQFHAYRIKSIVNNHRAFMYELTHHAG